MTTILALFQVWEGAWPEKGGGMFTRLNGVTRRTR